MNKIVTIFILLFISTGFIPIEEENKYNQKVEILKKMIGKWNISKIQLDGTHWTFPGIQSVEVIDTTHLCLIVKYYDDNNLQNDCSLITGSACHPIKYCIISKHRNYIYRLDSFDIQNKIFVFKQEYQNIPDNYFPIQLLITNISFDLSHENKIIQVGIIDGISSNTNPDSGEVTRDTLIWERIN